MRVQERLMPFAYPHISFVAILAAVAAYFVLGLVWYSGLTPIGKRWATPPLRPI